MKRVLIVDDEPWQAAVYERTLQKEFVIDHVTNGYAAIERIDSAMPDILLLDVLLAGSTGWTLLHELQSHTDLAKLPVILVTNSAIEKTEQLHQYGVVCALDKATMLPQDLLREVRKVIG